MREVGNNFHAGFNTAFRLLTHGRNWYDPTPYINDPQSVELSTRCRFYWVIYNFRNVQSPNNASFYVNIITYCKFQRPARTYASQFVRRKQTQFPTVAGRARFPTCAFSLIDGLRDRIAMRHTLVKPPQRRAPESTLPTGLYMGRYAQVMHNYTPTPPNAHCEGAHGYFFTTPALAADCRFFLLSEEFYRLLAPTPRTAPLFPTIKVFNGVSR